ncbi:MAG TPA: amino acid adenylation domain-containing protein [Candidatus Angelobacter sp.]|nr:amino acid adenylation domain-containing protein [Candidatus Angelobacter sp.]
MRGYEAPQGEIETQLAETWADLLHVERVGRHDDFFALGGHSLLAVRLMERMRRKGLQVDVRALFATPTLAGLASGIGGQETIVEVPANRIPAECAAITPEMLPLIDLKQEEIDQIVEQVPGGIANVQDIYALSPLQKGILFHHLMGGEGDPYLGAVRLSFESRTRLDTYVKAMRAVIERHDILRTAVVWEGLREPVQVVWREAVLPVEEVELDPGAGDVAEQLYARFNPRQYRIDVRQAPLLRAYIAEDEEKERWLMVLLLHHLAGDRVTMEVMQEEMEAHLLGRAEQLPAPLPFRNLVAQARLGVSPEEHQAFFRQLLGDVTEPTAAFGLLDVQGDGTGIEEARITLEPDVAGRVRESARKLGVSAASLCHLAWAQVLARVSGREDVVFGTVLFGRMQGGAGADRVLGPFINTLPVRIQIGDEGVEAGVRRVHSQLSDLLRHEHASLALAQRCSGVAAPTPLFSALLNYRHSSEAVRGVSEDRRRAWKGIGVLYGQDLTNYPVTLSVDDLGEGFVLTAQVAARIGSMRVCEYMHTALKSLVEALESTPGKAINGLDVLPEKERKQLLYEWNATGMEYPREKCIQELFEEQVERTPAATAVVSEEESVNYDELNRRANRLAHHLREIGVKADERVGVCAERGVDMVVALLATLKAGGAYVPLDPEYPDDRLQYMMKNASPAAVLTQPHLQERLKAFSGRDLPVIALSPAARWQEQSAANCEHDEGGVNPERLAYVIYTSGSTGTPKGVMIEHRSIVNRLIWMQNAYGLKTEDAVLQKTPFSFDVSVWEFFWPLLVGARLVMARPGWHKDPIYLSETIERNRITTLHFVPSMLQAFLELGDSRRCSSVKRIICSGEALSADVAWRCREVLPLADLHNLYGPTEATVDVTSWTYPASGEKATTIPIGRPIANTRVYILDKNMHPVPVGVVGELYIGGVQIARGYLNRQDLTAERFVKDPVASQPGARIYRTGDLARWLEDGNIEYLGRNDYQVKIRGFRIELGEIEARLSEHPQVREVVVVAREDGGGGKRLVAYVVVAESKVEEERVRHSLQEHREMEAGELSAMLHTYLAGQLPEYMVPATYVRLERMPLTPNGKLDRRALPEPERDAYARRGYEEPQGETESKLAKIWENLLGTPQVGRHDNFFELGGHSLLVMQLMVEVQRSFGINISLRDVFISPTLAELAAALKRGDLAIRHQNLIPIRPAGTETPLFIVHALGGGVDYVADLAPFIDVNIPIYGLQATGFAPGEEPLKTIEEMAELYVDGIRQVQPHGPYRVAGWSAGGTIAYAMARRLIELGGEVGFVGLLDTICYERTTMDSESGRPKDFDANFELIEVLLMIHLDKKDLDDVIQMAQIYDFETLIERGRHIMDKIAKKIPEVHTLDVSFLRRILKIRHATANALLNYSCVRLSMPVWLFEAKESVPPSGPAWRRLLGDDIQVVPVQGTHHTMTTGLENLSSLGAAITGALAKNSVQIVSFPSSHSLTLSAADI